MLVIRQPDEVALIDQYELRLLVSRRFEELMEGYTDPVEEMGYFVVVQPGDTVEAIEKETVYPLLKDYLSNANFGEDGFMSAFEWLVEHPSSYEGVFIYNDAGFGVDVIFPKQAGIDARLLSMCASLATPETETVPLMLSFAGGDNDTA